MRLVSLVWRYSTRAERISVLIVLAMCLFVGVAEADVGFAGARASAMGSVTTSTVTSTTRVTTYTYEGHFIDYTAHTPKCAPTPTGTKLKLRYYTDGTMKLDLTGQKWATIKECTKTGVPEREAEPALAARWGEEHCSQTTHCYDIASWEMTGAEQVEGSRARITSRIIEVPGWEHGDFVDHEQWQAFGEWWLEAGVTVGEYMGFSSQHPFYAYSNKSGYHELLEEHFSVPTGSSNEFMFHSLGGGEWAIEWFLPTLSDAPERMAVIKGFPTYSNDIDVGAEVVADNIEPQATGNDFSVGQHLNGSYYTWNKEHVYHDQQCWARNPDFPYLGDIVFWTKRNGPLC